MPAAILFYKFRSAARMRATSTEHQSSKGTERDHETRNVTKTLHQRTARPLQRGESANQGAAENGQRRFFGKIGRCLRKAPETNRDARRTPGGNLRGAR